MKSRSGFASFRTFGARGLAMSLALLAMANQAAAHGVWLGLPVLNISSATLAKVDQNVLAGNGPVVVGDIVEIIAAVPVIADGATSGGGGWRRESYDVRSTPLEDEVVQGYLSSTNLDRGH